MLNVISYGGGVQSTALLVLAAQGKIPHRTAVFSNVGEQAEHPTTLDFVRNVATPWAAEHGIEVHEIQRTRRDGTPVDLYAELMRDTRSIGIPVRMANGAPGNRNCTAEHKIKPVAKWLKANGATADNPAHVAIGISTDEIERANNRRQIAWEIVDYPLLDLGLDRSACSQLIADAGLPVPPKSSCWFCPFLRPATWAEKRRDEPEMFERAAQLEDTLNLRRDKLGKDHVYLTRFARPLREAITEAQAPLFDGDGLDGCDSGWCMT